MLQQERFFKIVEYLKKNRTAEYAVLAELNKVSVGTVRRDLAQLEKNAMIKVVRGGAAYRGDNFAKQPFDTRIMERKAEKHQLAELASEVVEEGQAIALNSGTTNLEIAEFLTENYRHLTVITNNLYVLHILERAKEFNLILTGGLFDPGENAIYGKQCESDFSSYNIDVAFLAANSISPEKGVTDFRIHEVPIMKAILKTARKKVLAVDSSKLEKVACANVCDLKDLDLVMTDSGGEKAIKIYGEIGLKVITPDSR